ILILADHSVFINDMLLQDDNNNFDFTKQTIAWLRGGPQNPRKRILYCQDGQIVTDFHVDLKQIEVPPVLPPVPKLKSSAEKVEQTLGDMEDSGELYALLKKALHSITSDGGMLGVLVLTLSLVFALYGFSTLIRARRRVDSDLPLPPVHLATAGPPLVQQRQNAMLKTGNLWEHARDLAGDCFANVLTSPPAAGHRVPEPIIEVSGGWWQRRRLGNQVRRLWQLAYGTLPQRVPPLLWARFLQDLDTV